MKTDDVYLRHILDCIHRIEENTKGGKTIFLSTHTFQDAVLRNLQTMTEASQRLSEELKTTEPAIDWNRMAAFRNVLVHSYLGIDLEQVWLIVERDAPPLKLAAERMLRRLS